MEKSMAIFFCMFLILGPVAAQADKVTQALPNWLTGIISVAVFLFLVFVAFLVNKAWCDIPSFSEEEAVISNEYAMTNGSSTYETSLDTARGSNNTYEDVIVHQTDVKVTMM